MMVDKLMSSFCLSGILSEILPMIDELKAMLRGRRTCYDVADRDDAASVGDCKPKALVIEFVCVVQERNVGANHERVYQDHLHERLAEID